MSRHSVPPGSRYTEAGRRLHQLLERLDHEVVGQHPLFERLVMALLAEGHVLLEGVPGLAKTRAVTRLAAAIDLPCRRISFTPDLLPADLTGTLIYRPNEGRFDLQLGPIHTSVLLADEINRAPAKVQSALLEAMQERRVTIGDRVLPLPHTFWVLATQNPIEQEGTYPLPEAQLDRFLMKLVVRYPAREAELAMLEIDDLRRPGTTLAAPDLRHRTGQGRTGETVSAPTTSDPLHPPLLHEDDLDDLRQLTTEVYVAPAIREYLVDLIRATRQPSAFGLKDLDSLIELGASPRATLALFRAAQASALLDGRDYVTPHDVKSLAPDVLRHRLRPSFEAEAEDLDPDTLLGRILESIPVP